MVDRTIIDPLEQMRDFDFVMFEHDTMVGLGQLAQDVLSGLTIPSIVAGLVVGASQATLSFVVGPGSIYTLTQADAVSTGSIPQDLTAIVQQGLLASTGGGIVGQLITLTAPTAGKSQWNLVQGQFQQVDAVRAGDPNGGVVPFFNPSNPAVPNPTSINTVRQGRLILQVVTGTPATTGSEVPPQPTPNWTPLYLVDVAGGQTTIIPAQVLKAGPSVGTGVPSNYPAAPFLAGLLASHHGGVVGQAPKILLGTETQGVLPYAQMSPVRQTIAAPITLFVNSSTGNDANNGLSPSFPFRTIQAAVTTLQNFYDLSGFGATISLANGTYTATAGSTVVTCGGGFVGAINQTQVLVQGNNSSPGSVVISAPATGGIGVSLPQGGALNFSGVTFSGSATAAGAVSVGQNGLFAVSGPCIFGACGGFHVSVVNGGGCFLNASYTISGSTPVHLASSNGGWIDYGLPGVVVTLTGTPAFSGAFASCADAGRLLALHTFVSFSGAATGTRFSVNSLALIDTQGGGANFLPGSIAGVGSGTNGALYL